MNRTELRERLEAQCWGLSEDMIEPMLALGMGKLPVLVRCHSHRFTTSLDKLEADIKRVEHEVRDASTWPESFDSYDAGLGDIAPPRSAYVGR